MRTFERLSDERLRHLALEHPPWHAPTLVEIFKECIARGRTQDAQSLISLILSLWLEKTRKDFAKLNKQIEPDANADEQFALLAAWELVHVDRDAVAIALQQYDESDKPMGAGLNEPDWPWPKTEPPPSRGGAAGFFERDHSGLWICGYRVGKGSEMSLSERRRFLDYYFTHPLPSIVAQYCGDEFGDPGSEKRLQKMANVIASNCRNFKRINREKYHHAIQNYETDLAYLKKYYRAGNFPWPPIE